MKRLLVAAMMIVAALSLSACASAAPAATAPSPAIESATPTPSATASDNEGEDEAAAEGEELHLTFDPYVPLSNEVILTMKPNFATNDDFVMEKDEPNVKRFMHTPTDASVIVTIGPWEQQHADVQTDTLVMIANYYEETAISEKYQVIQIPWEKGNMDFVLQASTDETGTFGILAARTLPETGQATFINILAPDLASAEEALNVTAENINYAFARP